MPKTKADIIKEEPPIEEHHEISEKTIDLGYVEGKTEKKTQIAEQMDEIDANIVNILNSLKELQTKLEPICSTLENVPPLPTPQDAEHLVPFAQYLNKKNSVMRQANNDLQLILESIQI